MTRIIAVSTNKGGAGKSTISTNLIGILAKEGYKVLLIDTDNQGNAALSFGINPDDIEYTLYDVLVDGLPIQRTILNVYKNIDFIPANDELAFFEFDVLTKGTQYKKPFELLREQIKYIEEDYDFIILDTPPNLGLTQGNVLAYVSEVLIPYLPEPYSMRSLVKILKAIRDFKEVHNPDLEVLGVVASMVDRRTSQHDRLIQSARAYCYEKGITMFDTEIGDRMLYPNSVEDYGLPATLVNSKKKVQVYYDLMGEILNVTKETT